MTKPKLTEWFPPEVKPVRVGVYEVDHPPGRWFRKWDGKTWLCGSKAPQRAAKNTLQLDHPSDRRSWRGLAEEPK